METKITAEREAHFYSQEQYALFTNATRREEDQ